MQGFLTALALETNPIDAEGNQWIEVMPTVARAINGPWKFSITREDLEVYAASIREQGDRLSIDFDHKAQDGDTVAAAWFTGEAKIDETDPANPKLLARVRWTPRGRQSVENRDYRFISPEWQMAAKSASGWWTGAKRFVAATLTNRPFFKELAPVANDAGDPAEGDENMPLKALAAALGLPETATEEQILAAAEKAKTEAAKASELETENATLKATAEKVEGVDLEKLQQDAQAGVQAAEENRVLRRDTLLADAVRERKIDPAQKDEYAKMFDKAPEETTALIASLKPGKIGAIGHEGENEGEGTAVASGRQGDISGTRLPETITISGSEYPVDSESAKIHLGAMKVLEEAGKRLNHTADEYEAACLVAADQQGVRL